jgi:hypothetical protein
MPQNEPGPDRGVRSLPSRAGFVLAVFAVFACGWLAMQTDDWRRIVLFTVLAGVAGVVATAFKRRSGRP